MRLHDGEPQLGNELVLPLARLLDRLMAGRPGMGGPFLVAIDGRSSNGKTTLAGRLAALVDGAEVVHTDDVAWWHSRFGWDDLLIDGVIGPLRSGQDVTYRPPAWDDRNRDGAIVVSSAAPLVIIEGVGSGRRSLCELVDAVVWVQSDLDLTENRNAVRVAAGETDQAGYDAWMSEESPVPGRGTNLGTRGRRRRRHADLSA